MYENTQPSMGLFSNLNRLSAQSITGDRYGGGRGGGSEPLQVDPMETNRFVEMNLSPYLTDNVHSFAGGGSYMARKDTGERVDPYSNLMPGAAGYYTQEADKLIAMNQVTNLMRRLNSPYMGSMIPKYNEGGVTIAEANASGNPYVKNKDGSATILSTKEQRAERSNRLQERGLSDALNIELTNRQTGETQMVSESSQAYKDIMPDWYNTDYGRQWNQRFNPYKPMGEHDRVDVPVEGGMETPFGNRPAMTFDRNLIGQNWGDIMPSMYPGYNPTMQGQHAPMAPPMANKGMKYKYNTGGEFANQLGGLVTKLQKEMPDPQDAVNLISKLTNNQQPPMANKGMKMRKRYTQGGRF